MPPPVSNISIPTGMTVQKDGTTVVESPVALDFLPTGATAEEDLPDNPYVLDLDISALASHRGLGAYKHRGTSPFSSWYSLGVPCGLGAIAADAVEGGVVKVYQFLPALETGTIDKIYVGSKTGTSGNGGACSVVCYRATSQTNLYPSALVFETSDFQWTATPSTPSVYEIAVSGTLVGGVVHWMGIWGKGPGNVGIRGYSSRFMIPLVGIGVPGAPIQTQVYLSSSAFGVGDPAPDPFPAGSTFSAASTGFPNLFYHYAT